MCHCLHEVVSQRLMQPCSLTSDAVVTVIGTVVFLRFINPALVSPVENDVLDQEPAFKVKRTCTLVGKLLQSIANHSLFPKEPHMRAFHDFVRANFDYAKRCFYYCILI